MDIQYNFDIIIKQLFNIFSSFFNRTIIVATSAQIFSMIAKMIINSIKERKLTLKNIANYGGMPSSHTVFIMAYIFSLALDPAYGWRDPLFSLSIVFGAITLMDTIRFRGTVDKINEILQNIVDKNSLENQKKFPKFIAHKTSEVIGGIVFAFFYTFIFHLLFFKFFEK